MDFEVSRYLGKYAMIAVGHIAVHFCFTKEPPDHMALKPTDKVKVETREEIDQKLFDYLHVPENLKTCFPPKKKATATATASLMPSIKPWISATNPAKRLSAKPGKNAKVKHRRISFQSTPAYCRLHR